MKQASSYIALAISVVFGWVSWQIIFSLGVDIEEKTGSSIGAVLVFMCLPLGAIITIVFTKAAYVIALGESNPDRKSKEIFAISLSILASLSSCLVMASGAEGIPDLLFFPIAVLE